MGRTRGRFASYRRTNALTRCKANLFWINYRLDFLGEIRGRRPGNTLEDSEGEDSEGTRETARMLETWSRSPSDRAILDRAISFFFPIFPRRCADHGRAVRRGSMGDGGGKIEAGPILSENGRINARHNGGETHE